MVVFRWLGHVEINGCRRLIWHYSTAFKLFLLLRDIYTHLRSFSILYACRICLSRFDVCGCVLFCLFFRFYSAFSMFLILFVYFFFVVVVVFFFYSCHSFVILLPNAASKKSNHSLFATEYFKLKFWNVPFYTVFVCARAFV